MAQDAELKLKVSLDLAFFRQQLIGLGQASAGYKLPVQVQFDRRSVQNELNALGANIRRRNYTLEVKTNLKQEIKNAKDLAAELAKLSTGAGGTIPRRSGTFRQELSNINLGQIQQIYAAAAKAGLVAFSEEINKEKGKIITALNQAANDASQGFLNAFSSQNSAVRKAAGDYGNALLGGLRKTLRSQSPSQEMFDIGEDAGKGFELGLLRSMELAEQSATRKMRRMLDRLARVALMASGMSATEINRQAGQFQGGTSIAAPSWASTVPPSRGGSGGGRLLPSGPTFAALGGTAFGAQKYLPTDLSAELKQILQGAAFAFVDAIRMETRSVRVGISASMQAMLPASRVAGLLPAGVGREPSRYATGAIGGETREQMFARRTQEAYTRSGLRGIDIMGGGVGREPSPYSYAYKPISRAIVPYQAPGALVATGGGGGAQPPQGPTGGGGFRNAMGLGPSAQPINLDVFNRARVPLSGAIKELSSEFANATKQVLLFGTAYKGLAFFMDLPNQAFQAAKGLATYKNQLQAVTAESGTFEQSFAFVDNLATRFNVPLESARQGFVKLYASMQPAGFDQGQIEGLFTGISKAAAAFGLSSDKVDRVNYAFAQMASKGQIMSEELKGQLGDVLPGALGLFAQAAQMSIPEFSKAMEDGAFKGEAMAQVLGNVAILMNDKFGPAAQGAAKTLQGALNQMQNNLQLMYESMTPIVNQFASAFGGQINSLIKDVTNAIKLLTGNVINASEAVATLSPRSQAMYAVFQQLGPSIANAASNIGRFLSSLQILIGPLVAITKGLLDFVSIPFVARIGLYATIVTALNGAFQLLATTGILQATIALIRFATSLNIAQINVYIAGIQTVIAVLRNLITTANVARLALMGLKVALVSFGVGVVLLALDAVAQRLLNIGDAANSAKKNTRELAQELDRIAGSGDIEAATKQYLDANTKLAMAQKKNRAALAELRRLERAAGPRAEGAEPFVVKEARKTSEAAYSNMLQARRDVQAARQTRNMAVQTKEQQNQKTQTQLKPIDLSGSQEGRTSKIKEYYRDVSDSLLDIGQKEKDNLQLRYLNGAITERQYDLGVAAIELEVAKKVAAEQLRVGMARLNDENLSAGDKLLKQKDLQIKSENAIALAKSKYNIAVEKSLFELEQPFDEAIRDEGLAMAKTETQINAYRQGRLQLTAAEEAAIIVSERTKDLDDEELTLLADKIKLYEETIALRIENNRLLEQEAEFAKAKAEVETIGAGLGAGFYGSAAQVFESQLAQGKPVEFAKQMADLETQSMRLQSVFGGIQNAIGGIGSAFGTLMTEGIASMVQGTATAQEVFSQFLNTIGQALMQAASQMIATYVAIGIARIFAGMGGGGGGYAQGNVSTDAFTGGGIPGLSNTASVSGSSFGGFTGGSFGVGKFANGGIVNGPTLGLIGEGKYNEAIVPLPDGRAIPVQMQGDSVRDKMNGSGNGGAAASPMLSMNFETTTINNVEYVSREQLEKAMMETRKLATRDGARQGANLAIDKIQQSPNTRRRIGI
jgi:tape measure domain-containing protein